MSFEADLVARLRANATIAGMVGTRIYWEERPQGSGLPAILLTGVGGERRQHMDGPMATQSLRTQFDCMAPTKAQAVTLRQAVTALIEAPGTAGTTDFQGGFTTVLPGRSDINTVDGTVRTERTDATIWFN